MLDFAIFAVTFVVALIVAVIYLYPGSSKPTTIPGLEPTDPKDGNLADMGKAGSIHEFLTELHEQFGDITSFWMGQQLVVSIASPALFKEHMAVFDRPPLLFKLFEPLITPVCIQFANGADGRKRRNNYDKALSHQAVMDNVELFNKLAIDMCKKIDSLSKDEHIPLREYMFAISIKIITVTTMGKRFTDDREVFNFRKNYDTCFQEMESRLGGDFPASDSPRQKRFDKNKDEMFKVINEIIAQRKKNPPAEGDEALIDMIMKGASSDDEVAGDVLCYVVAGFHTSGLLLTWAVYFLATHEEIQEKVYKELIEVLGDQNVSPTIISDLVYMRQVLDETMRCSVLAPFAARFQDIDVELGGHKVPAGTPVVHALGVVLQDSRIYPQPNIFDPERFNEENSKKLPPHAFEPFGFAGKRKCPGYRFSYAEVTVILSELLRKYRIKMVEGQIVQQKFGLVTTPVDEIWVTVEKRK